MKIKASEAVPGQWYEDHLGRQFLCIDHMRAYYRTSGFFAINAKEQLTHIPDCTGWDWQPPKPEKRYRAFASAKEFAPHRDRWISREVGCLCKIASYSDEGVTAGTCNREFTWQELFDSWIFSDDGSDGEPFGVEVSE